MLDTGNGPVANVNSKGANGQFGANMVLRTIPDAQSHQGMTLLHLDENGARPYSRAHDQRRDHSHCSPPPYRCGMGGHLRLRYQPLPPDPVRGTSFPNSAI
ncbi:MAG TPA: hypothetical protein VK621_23440 [Bradyrhizobium sp.]|nr:hypothetical protein [Bradyrhizobium sp.]